MVDEGHVEVLGQSGGLVEDHGLEQFDLFQPGPLEKIILEKINQVMTHNPQLSRNEMNLSR